MVCHFSRWKRRSSFSPIWWHKQDTNQLRCGEPYVWSGDVNDQSMLHPTLLLGFFKPRDQFNPFHEKSPHLHDQSTQIRRCGKRHFKDISLNYFLRSTRSIARYSGFPDAEKFRDFVIFLLYTSNFTLLLWSK